MNAIEPDPVQRLFAQLHRSTVAMTVVPEVDTILERASRRDRSRAAFAAGAAVLTVAAVVALVFTGPLRSGRALPVAPTPPTATVTPTVTTTPPEPEGGTRVDVSQSIPADFLETPLLPLSIDDSTAPREYRGDGQLHDQCAGDPVDAVTIVRAAPDSTVVRIGLNLYPDEAAASAALAGLDLQACVGFAANQVSPTQWPSFGDESVAVTTLRARDGAGEMAGMAEHAVAVRVGRAIEVFTSSPEIRRPALDGIVVAASPQRLAAVIAESLPRLCLYTADGCRPASGLPAALPSLTQGGAVVLLDLYAYVPGDPVAGRVLVRAVELGYQPAIVTPGCDYDPVTRRAVEFGNDKVRYPALYFADRAQALSVAAAIGEGWVGEIEPTLRLHDVQTRCVA